jgi:hypothetical protein
LIRDEINIARPTIAYSWLKNIGDLITKAKLHQAPGITSSIIWRGGLRLDWLHSNPPKLRQRRRTERNFSFSHVKSISDFYVYGCEILKGVFQQR